MSDRMKLIPFDQLMAWILAEYRQEKTIFGVQPQWLAKQTGNPGLALAGRHPEFPIGPAAGPHTQLAQNIIAAYAAGARYFELKTVQVLDGEDLKVAKPCIAVPEEGYNVEWSTELTVPEAFNEYIKAWLALHVLAVEFGLGSPQGFEFNMSVGYDLAGIQSAKINTFIDNLMDASGTAAWQSGLQHLLEHAGQFARISRPDIEKISPRICSSVTLSTLHGCPPQEIEKIAVYLLTEKKLDTMIKCNPTMLGYPFARSVLNQLGYGTVSFDGHHFQDDLQFDTAVAMIGRLQAVAQEQGKLFGVKLTNTLPVQILQHELPGDEMYLSGPALYPLAINLACRLAEAFSGRINISYCGGADFFNCRKILRTGIWPLTLATSLLKPGGYARLTQLVESIIQEAPVTSPAALDIPALCQLAAEAASGPEYRKKRPQAASRKLDLKVPLLDCFIAPCKNGCPFGQDVPEYIHLTGEGRHLDALRVITSRNPLPVLTGMFCDRKCMAKCTRIDCDEAVNIRTIKLCAARQALAELIAGLAEPQFRLGLSAACIGGTPAGLAAAWFLCRNGIATTVFEKNAALGNLGKPVTPAFRQAVEQDLELLRQGGVRFEEEAVPPESARELAERGYQFVFDARAYLDHSCSIADGIAAGTRFADQVIRQVAGRPLAFDRPEVLDHQGIYQDILAKKGRLRKSGSPETEPGRCLTCNILCNICIEVCPNRANVAIKMPGTDGGCLNQVVHLDGPCNACGNCTTFCPYDSAPYREKFTLFWTESDFYESINDGFVLLDRERSRCRVRLGGTIRELGLNDPSGQDTGSLPETVIGLIRTTVQDYSHIFTSPARGVT